MRKKKKILQNHHLIYENEKHKQDDVIETIYKGEHWILTLMQRRKNWSKGFIKSVKLLLLLNEDKAKELNEDKAKDLGKDNEINKKINVEV